MVWEYPFRVCVTENMDSVAYEPIGEENLYTMILQSILVAIDQKRWSRLKACPDCRWVFYDYSEMGVNVGVVCMLEVKMGERVVRLRK